MLFSRADVKNRRYKRQQLSNCPHNKCERTRFPFESFILYIQLMLIAIAPIGATGGAAAIAAAPAAS